MLLKNTLLATAMFALGGFAMTASAATTVSTTFPVKITIQSACTIASATSNPIDFGTVASNTAAGNASLTTSNTLSVTCTNGTPYNIGMHTVTGDAGVGSMKGVDAGNSTDAVGYTLYKPSAVGGAGTITADAWGNTAASYFAATGSGIAQSIKVFATVTDANHKAGAYLDTVTVNVVY